MSKKKKYQASKEYKSLVWYNTIGLQTTCIGQKEGHWVEIPDSSTPKQVLQTVQELQGVKVRLTYNKPIIVISMPVVAFRLANLQGVAQYSNYDKSKNALLFAISDDTETNEELEKLDRTLFSIKNNFSASFQLNQLPKFTLKPNQKLKTLLPITIEIIDRLLEVQEKIQSNTGFHFNINHTNNVRYPSDLLKWLSTAHNMPNNARKVLDGILSAITDSTFILQPDLLPVRVEWKEFYNGLKFSRNAETKELACIQALNDLKNVVLPNGNRILEDYRIEAGMVIFTCNHLLNILKEKNTKRNCFAYNNSCRTAKANCFIDYLTWIQRGTRQNKTLAISMENLIERLNLQHLLKNYEWTRLAQQLNQICAIALEKGLIVDFKPFTKVVIQYLLNHKNKLKHIILISRVASDTKTMEDKHG